MNRAPIAAICGDPAVCRSPISALGFRHNSYYQLMLTLVPIWAAFGVSWNMLSGYTGLISFGHAAFFGIGAYTMTIALRHVRHLAVARHSARHRSRRRRRHHHRLADIPPARALLRAGDARLSAGHALRFEWLGFQEVTLPMKREAPTSSMPIQRSAGLHGAGADPVSCSA